MRLIALAAFAGLLATAAHADTAEHCAAAWKEKLPSATIMGSYEAWSTKCLARDYSVAATVPAATVPAAVPAGATAQCMDGTYSTTRESGASCSHHGGVARVL